MISIQQLKAKHQTICLQARELCSQRGDEYATREDTLKTFREWAKACKQKASKLCWEMLSLKVIRMNEDMLKGKVPTDSIRDCINYAVYLEILLEEEALG